MSGVKSDTTVIWLAAAVASVNFLATLIGLYLVSRIGRRTLTLGSLGRKFLGHIEKTNCRNPKGSIFGPTKVEVYTVLYGALQFFKRGMFIRGKFSMQKCSV